MLRLAVKVAQGNNARSGFAQLYKDGPTDLGTPVNGQCVLTPDDPAESPTICLVSFDGVGGNPPPEELGQLDSLSVFVQTDSGSFEAATACVVLQSQPSP